MSPTEAKDKETAARPVLIEPRMLLKVGLKCIGSACTELSELIKN